MARPNSLLTPRHPSWYEDLPERTSPPDGEAFIADDLNAIAPTYLEVSRASGVGRGAGIFSLLLGLGATPLVALLLFGGDGFLDNVNEAGLVPVLFLMMMYIFFVLLIVWAVRSDFLLPRDRPVRMNRIKRKVYVFEYKKNLNPFGRWRSQARHQ